MVPEDEGAAWPDSPSALCTGPIVISSQVLGPGDHLPKKRDGTAAARQNDLICAPQPMILEEAPAAQNGGYFSPSSPAIRTSVSPAHPRKARM